MTDGLATANWLRMKEAAAEAAPRGVAVFAMHEPFWSGDRIHERVSLGARFLRPLAAATGGLFRVNDSPDRAGWQDPLTLSARRASDERLTVHAPAWIWVE